MNDNKTHPWCAWEGSKMNMHQFIYEIFSKVVRSDKKQCVNEKIENDIERVRVAVANAYIYYSFTLDIERAYKRFIEEVC